MNLQQVDAKVIEIIADQLGISKEDIAGLNKLFDWYGRYRIDGCKLLTVLKDQFCIDIVITDLYEDVDDFYKTKTVSEIQKLIQKKLNITE
jgi:acyl carrier protein